MFSHFFVYTIVTIVFILHIIQDFKPIINFHNIFLLPLWILKHIHYFLFSVYLFSVFVLNFTLKFILNKLWFDPMSGPLSALMYVIALLNLLLLKTWSIWFVVLPSVEYRFSLWISLCGNVLQSHFVDSKSHMDLPGTKLGPLWWETSDFHSKLDNWDVWVLWLSDISSFYFILLKYFL